MTRGRIDTLRRMSTHRNPWFERMSKYARTLLELPVKKDTQSEEINYLTGKDIAEHSISFGLALGEDIV